MADHEPGSSESLEYLRGRRAAEIAAHTAEQDRHLEAINGSIGEMERGMGTLNDRLVDLQLHFEKFASAVTAAAEANVSSRAFLLGVAAIVTTLAAAVITIVASGG